VTVESDPFRLVVRLLIAIFCSAALLLIVVILSGSRLDDTSGKAIATAVGFAIFSLTATAGIALSDKQQSAALFGYAVAGISAAAFLSGAFALWLEANGDDWELPGILFVLALGGSHVSLLLKGSREEDSEGVRWLRAGVLLAIGVLCTMAIVEISSNGSDTDPRAFGVIAILYLLGTALIPLVRRNSTARAPTERPSASELLRKNGHVLLEGPVSRGGVHGTGQNVCLRDPDGTLIEVITYDAR
jgi:hypothetical protein